MSGSGSVSGHIQNGWALGYRGLSASQLILDVNIQGAANVTLKSGIESMGTFPIYFDHGRHPRSKVDFITLSSR